MVSHMSGDAMKIEMPEALTYYTADEVAECIGYQEHLAKERADALYAFLWRTLSESKNPTPIGGDGSDGTVELPEDRLSLENDDKTGHWWGRLDRDWQEALVKAASSEGE